MPLVVIIKLQLLVLKREKEVLVVVEIVHGDAKNVILLQQMSLIEDLQCMTHIMNNGHIHMKNFMLNQKKNQFNILIDL
jgi:hypothetical protein